MKLRQRADIERGRPGRRQRLAVGHEQAQSIVVRRAISPTAGYLLHALLVLAVMLIGIAIPAAGAATGISPNATAHADHHGPDPMPDHRSGHAQLDDPADSPMTDCCDGMACGCGCIGSQGVSMPATETLRAWAVPPGVITPLSAPSGANLIATPFRPPA